MPDSPIVARWEIARRLRQRRQELGLAPSTITKQLGLSAAYLSHIENERNLMAADKLRPLMTVLEIDEEEQRELLALHSVAKGRGWWTKYSAIFNDEIQRLHGLEFGAQGIRIHESVLMPGILQCPEYVQALMDSPFGVLSPAHSEPMAEARLRRQARLTHPDPLQLTALLNQGVLLQQPWGTDIARTQLRHLIGLIEEHPETLDIRIIPFDSPAVAALVGVTVYLLDFASPRLPTLAWSENGASGHIVEDSMQVRELNHLYTTALAMVPSRDDSLELIKRTERQLSSTT
ncbi:DUF5753 domain-containing protein [Nocardia macrotermitis]|uniref:HTH cro/C1-type domain-containing protein n=1 Tax=Nocardia macrotermitis TaxID=2585198 RepID=A0A7K0D4R6_9NOCA|nr:DUF5753 domain-containing protein [Nocardia macrotermitis]MQY20708.1 hypothetical protein [Nocardia macrotermitis]